MVKSVRLLSGRPILASLLCHGSLVGDLWLVTLFRSGWLHSTVVMRIKQKRTVEAALCVQDKNEENKQRAAVLGQKSLSCLSPNLDFLWLFRIPGNGTLCMFRSAPPCC